MCAAIQRALAPAHWGCSRTQTGMTTTPARQPKGIPVGGQFADTVKTEADISLPPAPQQTPAAVLSSAAGTDRDPLTVPWPEDLPNKGYVEVWVAEDDVRSALEDTGQEDAVDGYDRIYAGISLQSGHEADFWGVKTDGTSDVIALGVHDYEQAVDPYSHADLNYRDGYTDPMPAYNASLDAVRARKAELAAALLEDAGITIDMEDQRRQQFRLRTKAGQDLQLRLGDFRRPQLIETKNWRTADDSHVEEFLGGPGTEESSELLVGAVTIVARDLHARSYKESA